jgi:hypothetical protein
VPFPVTQFDRRDFVPVRRCECFRCRFCARDDWCELRNRNTHARHRVTGRVHNDATNVQAVRRLPAAVINLKSRRSRDDCARAIILRRIGLARLLNETEGRRCAINHAYRSGLVGDEERRPRAMAVPPWSHQRIYPLCGRCADVHVSLIRFKVRRSKTGAHSATLNAPPRCWTAISRASYADAAVAVQKYLSGTRTSSPGRIGTRGPSSCTVVSVLVVPRRM